MTRGKKNTLLKVRLSYFLHTTTNLVVVFYFPFPSFPFEAQGGENCVNVSHVQPKMRGGDL